MHRKHKEGGLEQIMPSHPIKKWSMVKTKKTKMFKAMFTVSLCGVLHFLRKGKPDDKN